MTILDEANPRPNSVFDVIYPMRLGLGDRTKARFTTSINWAAATGFSRKANAPRRSA